VEKFLHHVNVTMRQTHNHKQLSIVVDRIESYDAVDAPSDECDKVSHNFLFYFMYVCMYVCMYTVLQRNVVNFLVLVELLRYVCLTFLLPVWLFC